MKKQTKRFCSAVLSVTTLLSMFTFLTPTATEVSTDNSQTDVSVKSDSGNEYADYNSTGDRSLGENTPESDIVINSVDEYYNVLAQNSSDGKLMDTFKDGENLPSSVDNSDNEFFPAIGSQGSIGACVAWAQSYYQFTYEFNKANNIKTTPENTFSPKFTYNLCNGGVDKGSTDSEVYQVMRIQGNVPWSMVPFDNNYLSWNPTEDVWKTSLKYRIESSQQFDDVGYDKNPITSADDEDLTVIKTALSNGDVLTYSTNISCWNYEKIKKNSEVPENDKYEGQEVVTEMYDTKGGHRMTLVGYNDNIWADVNENGKVDKGEMGAFKIANSWGDNYGNDGFMWIAYDALNKVSCVTGMEEKSTRSTIFKRVSRIDVRPYNSGAQVYLKYTLNSAYRNQTDIKVYAEKNGSIYSSTVCMGSAFSSNDNFSYDGTTNANDGTMVFALDNVTDEVNVDNFEEYAWSIEFIERTKDSKVMTVKNAEFVVEKNNRVYRPSGAYPFTLDGTKKTVKVTESNLNTAVIYYVGYDEPTITYDIGKSIITSYAVTAPMTVNKERRGYVNKYVIDLKDKSSAILYFTDSKGNKDNNNGSYFKAYKGLNYYSTPSAFTPIVPSISINHENVNEINADMMCLFTASATGGYEPYSYQFEYENLTTGEIESRTYSSYENSTQYFRKVGKYRIKLNVKDYSERVVSTEMVVNIIDEPFEFSEFSVDHSKRVVVGSPAKFNAVTYCEHIQPYAGGNTYKLEIKKGNEVCYTNDQIRCKKGSTSYMTAEIEAEWTPTQAGTYTATISCTDFKKEYAEKTISFEVKNYIVGDANEDSRISVVDVTAMQQYLSELIDGSLLPVPVADCDRNGLIDVRDVTCIQRYISEYDEYGYVSYPNGRNPLDPDPTTVPTTAPTTAPTTQPTTVATKNKVTFTNSFHWGGTIYCYYWSDSNPSMTSWPGKAMTYLTTNDYGEKMYTFEVPQGATYIIFSNGSTQTTDIKYPGGEVRYYPISSTDSKGHNLVATW